MKLQSLFETDAPDLVAKMSQQYPVASARVDGLLVRKEVPNTSSIEASFNHYTVLPKIRVCTFEGWNVNPHTFFYSPNDSKRSQSLAMQIKESGEISPLIMAVNSADELWIVEGGHRFLALHLLGKKEFPALIVVDLE